MGALVWVEFTLIESESLWFDCRIPSSRLKPLMLCLHVVAIGAALQCLVSRVAMCECTQYP
jgi:hypothetical protein